MKLRSHEKLTTDDIKEVSKGALDFASYIKPHALMNPNVKQLLLDDKDYSTPADHYFSYIQKRKMMEAENEREKAVLDKIGIDKLLPLDY